MSTAGTSYHFRHLLQVSKKSLVYSPRAGADNPLGTKFWSQQEHLVTSVICRKFKKKSSGELIKAYFHFSHNNSMETVSCHSDESAWSTAIKNIIFVEANVMNISTKFQLHHLRRRFFLIFFRKLSISVAMATNQIQGFGQNSYGC